MDDQDNETKVEPLEQPAPPEEQQPPPSQERPTLQKIADNLRNWMKERN